MATSQAAPRAFFDPWAHLPGGPALRAACEAGDIPAALSLTRALSAHDDVASALWNIAEHGLHPDQRAGYTLAVEAADDGTPLGRTLTGVRYVTVGWSIRTRQRAEHVSPAQFEQFFDWLRRAERVLFDVCAEHPGFAPAWEVRITTARGLQLGHGEARRRYDRLVALEPAVFAAQRVFLQQILPKWGGSWEEASRFVEECASVAAPGSLGPALVADHAIERWLDGERSVPSATVDRMRSAAAATVLHPEHTWTAATAVAHTNFALFFSIAKHPADAWPHFDALDRSPVEGLWNYYAARPASAYDAAQRNAAAAVARRRVRRS